MPALPMGDIGPCQVVWAYGESGEAELGPTLGTVTLAMEETINDVQEEGFGDAPVDAVGAGAVLRLTVPFARQTLDQLEIILLSVRNVDELPLFSKCGCAMYDDAKEIVLKPLCNNVPNPDSATWIRIFHAHPTRAFELGFDRSGQRVFNCPFKCFISQESATYGQYGTVGVN